ncbi:MAG: hypothetical protein L7R83_02850 [Candidatus Poseidonia sp.]|nr:hypothetical protein [Poseidonia sp.]
MTWNVAWSWQAEGRIAALAAVEGGLLVSSGLRLELLEADGSTRWAVDVPFKVHAAYASQGTVGVLAAHGFFLLNTSDGSMVNEGRSAPAGFSDLRPRPGGGWALAGRRGEIHLFSQHGRGIRRVESGPVRRLLGWLDREHLLWQDPDGHLWCGRLTGDDRKRLLEERSWSWCSSLIDGRLLLQSSDGGLWEGIPHPFGWDAINRLEYDSVEPMSAVRTGDGWWVLGIEGHLLSMTEPDDGSDETPLTRGMNLGDLLVLCTPDAMATATRDGLVRRWTAPHLADAEREGRYKAAAEAAMARNWEERRQMFLRAQEAEDLGKLSLAIELYEALGRAEDARRLLKRQKEGGE